MRALTLFRSAFGTYKSDLGSIDQQTAHEKTLEDAETGLNLPYIPQSRIELETSRVVLVTELGSIEAFLLAPVVVLLLSDPIMAETPNPIIFVIGLLALLLPRALGHLRHQHVLKNFV